MRRIRTAILALALGCVLAVAGSIGVVTTALDRQRSVAAFERQTATFAEAAALASFDAAYHFDFAMLERLAGSLMANDAMVALRLVDDRGDALVERGPPGFWERHAAFCEAVCGRPGVATRTGARLSLAGAPIAVEGAPPVGHVLLARSGAGLAEALAARQTQLLATALGCLVPASAAAWWLARRLTRRIERLTEAADRVREGALGTLVPVEGRDEIARMGRSLRDMVARLAEAIAERQAVAAVLEETARAREVALRDAQAAARAKSEFLATMSHEIRTPLNAVLGMADLLQEAGLEPELRGYADAIAASGDGLLRILNDILDLSKADAGQLEIVHEPFDLRELVEGVGALLGPVAARKGVEVVVDVDPALPALLVGDEGRLRQVLVNLVGNAVKFTEAGHVLVSVEGQVSAGRAELRVGVHDTGPGIPEAALGRIFEAFRQADGTTSRRYGGTGLGLAIVARLTELMGGEIEATSRLGRGATFVVRLRLDVAEGAGAAGAPEETLAGRRVLIVDRNAATRHALAHLAAALGADAVVGASLNEGREAFARAAKEGRPFAAVVLDEAPSRGVDWPGAAIAVAAPPTGRLGAQLRGVQALFKPVARRALMGFLAGRPIPGGGARPAPDAAAALDPDGRLAVLLVEDNRTNQTLVRAMLRDQPVDLAMAKDGRAAVGMAKAGGFDVILMDLSMPEMDGLEATHRIREREAALGGGRVPIVALTANAFAEDRERCRAADMDGFLAKPLAKADLLAVLVQAQRGEMAFTGPARSGDEARDAA